MAEHWSYTVSLCPSTLKNLSAFIFLQVLILVSQCDASLSTGCVKYLPHWALLSFLRAYRNHKWPLYQRRRVLFCWLVTDKAKVMANTCMTPNTLNDHPPCLLPPQRLKHWLYDQVLAKLKTLPSDRWWLHCWALSLRLAGSLLSWLSNIEDPDMITGLNKSYHFCSRKRKNSPLFPKMLE